ncbi:MAG: 4Fe-4S binding protein [Clostridiales bacterium]|nr:4Fe-4S binding protein [Clostridiales bacterium]MCF8023043.1 4Fe-4S binding protein [Clostridiales bacterium]
MKYVINNTKICCLNLENIKERIIITLKKYIKEICELPDGVDLVGVAPVERFDQLPEDKRPGNILPGTKSVIVLGSQVFKVLTDKLTAQNEVGKVSCQDIYQAHNETVTNDLKQTGYRIARHLTNQGYPCINLGQDLTDYRTISSIFYFKYAAVAAGLGKIGKNGLLLTPAYGPRVKLSAVLTEAPLEEDPLIKEDLCKGCSICIDACPSGALKEPEENQQVNYDRFVCFSFLTNNNGCSLCMSKCPVGK